MKRGRLGTIVFALFVAEIVVFVLVARGIGWLPVIGATLGMSFFGVWLLGRGGAVRRVGEAVNENVAAGRPMLEGVGFALFPVLAALLFATPGFISDLAGALLFLPPLQRFLVRRFRLAPPPVLPPEDDDPDVIDV